MSEPTPSKKHKKSRDADGSGSAKKRKHNTTTEADAAQPTPSKKSRHNNATSNAPLNQSTTQADLPFTTSDTPFFTQTSSFYLALSPIAQRNPLEGLCAEHLSPLILTFYPPLKGVVLAYSNPRLSEQRPPTADKTPILSRAKDEYAVTYVWLTADFTVLRPARGAEIEGHITVQNPNQISLVCWNLFNASIERRRLPRKWRWSSRVGRARASSESAPPDTAASTGQDEGEGYFVDENGVKMQGMITFRIRDFDIAPEMGKEKGFTSIEGTMLDDEEERNMMNETVIGRRINRRLPGVESVAVRA